MGSSLRCTALSGQRRSGRGGHPVSDGVRVQRRPRGRVEPRGPAGLVGHPGGAEVRAQRGQVPVHVVDGQVGRYRGGGGVDHLGLEAEPPVGQEAGDPRVLVGVLAVPGDEVVVVQAFGRRAETKPGTTRISPRWKSYHRLYSSSEIASGGLLNTRCRFSDIRVLRVVAMPNRISFDMLLTSGRPS